MKDIYISIGDWSKEEKAPPDTKSYIARHELGYVTIDPIEPMVFWTPMVVPLKDKEAEKMWDWMVARYGEREAMRMVREKYGYVVKDFRKVVKNGQEDVDSARNRTSRGLQSKSKGRRNDGGVVRKKGPSKGK